MSVNTMREAGEEIAAFYLALVEQGVEPPIALQLTASWIMVCAQAAKQAADPIFDLFKK